MKLTRTLVFAAVLLAGFGFQAQLSIASAGQIAKGGDNCVEFLVPVLPGETESRASDLFCFDTLEQSLAAIPTLQEGLDPLLPSVENEGLATSAASSVCYQNGVIGLHYEHVGYGGASMVGVSYTCWEPRCDDGSRFLYGQISGPWNDRISSAQSFGGCQSRHWEQQSFGGAVLACNPNCWSMGVLNDKTSSISYIPNWA